MPSVNETEQFLQVSSNPWNDSIESASFLDFKKELEAQTADTYNKVEKALYDVYEENSATITEKLEELFATLDRIGMGIDAQE